MRSFLKEKGPHFFPMILTPRLMLPLLANLCTA
jgi:hypothetical protein